MEARRFRGYRQGSMGLTGIAMTRRTRAGRRTRGSVDELDRMILAPQPQGRLRGPCFEVVPVIEHAAPRQQILKPGVGASSAEKLPDLVDIAGQELAGEVESERLAELEFSFVRYRQKFFGIVDIIRQGVEVIDEFGMTSKSCRTACREKPDALRRRRRRRSRRPPRGP